MPEKTPQPERPGHPDTLLGWMQSIGDPMRLRILRLLERHELGVAELADVLQSPQSTISRHLKILLGDGWIRSRRSGTAHLSTLAMDEFDAARRKLWQLTREQMSEWQALRQDALRLQRLLSERSDAQQKFFSGAAGDWDRTRESLYGTAFASAAAIALMPAKYVVADLGCGTGQMLERLAPRVGRAIGVDNTPAMIRAARKRLEDFDHVEIREGELEALPLDDASVDAALMVLSLSYVAEPLVCLREMRRILRPGGRAVIVDVLRHDQEAFRREMGQTWPGFDTDDIASMARDAGLAGLHAEPLAPEAQARGPALFLATAVVL